MQTQATLAASKRREHYFRKSRVSFFFRFLWYKGKEGGRLKSVTIAQRDFGFAPRTILKLCVIEKLLKRHAVIQPPPSRPKLVALIEEGKIEGYKSEDLNCYFVFEDSFNAWLYRTAPPAPAGNDAQAVAA
jgi:hypothetical protein